MKKTETVDITELLQQWQAGNSQAAGPLLETAYRELRRLARVFLRSERDTHTLASVDLVQEAYLRLRGRRLTPWKDRRHFFAVTAQCMRRILVEHARRRLRLKHGAGSSPEALDSVMLVAAQRAPELVALDDALRTLAALDPFKAKLVELRYFGGFTIPETATLLACSHATVERHWRRAQAWLHAQLAAA